MVLFGKSGLMNEVDSPSSRDHREYCIQGASSPDQKSIDEKPRRFARRAKIDKHRYSALDGFRVMARNSRSSARGGY